MKKRSIVNENLRIESCSRYAIIKGKDLIWSECYDKDGYKLEQR